MLKENLEKIHAGLEQDTEKDIIFSLFSVNSTACG